MSDSALTPALHGRVDKEEFFSTPSVLADSPPLNDQGLFLLVSQHEKPKVTGGHISPLGAKTPRLAEPSIVEQEGHISKGDHLEPW